MKNNLLPFVSFCILSVLLLNSCGAKINEKESKSFNSKSANHKEDLKSSTDKQSDNRKVNLNPELRDNNRPRLQNSNYAGTITQSPTGKMTRNNSIKPINPISDPNLINQTSNNTTQQLLAENPKNTSASLEFSDGEHSRQENLNQNFQPQINNRVFGMSIGFIPKIKSPVINQVIEQNKKDQPINEQFELDNELQKELQGVLSEAVEKQKQIIAKYPKVKKQVDDKKLQIFVLCRYVS